MMKRRTMLAGLTAAVALGLSGCSVEFTSKPIGSGTSAGSTSSSTTKAAEETGFAFAKGDVVTSDFVEPVLAAQKKLKSFTVHMATETPDGSMVVTSEYEKVDGVEHSHSVIRTGETLVEQIFIGDQGYDKQEDGTWKKVNGVTVGAGADDSLEQFAKNVKSVKYVGDDGHGHKFELQVDVSKAMQKEGAVMGADMWLDDEMRMVRSEYVFDNGNGQASSVITRDGFDEEYNIKAPI